MHKIAMKHYSYECGDGCCSEFGYDYYVDGKLVHSSPCEDNAWLAILAELGIKAEIVHLDEEGDEISSLSN